MPDASQFTLGLFDAPGSDWGADAPNAGAAARFGSAGDPEDPDDPDHPPPAAAAPQTGENFYLDADRALARGWPARARDNVAAIRLSKALEASSRAPTAAEQARLLRFVGFGASELAQNAFPLPGAAGFRPGWAEIGEELAALTTPAEYAALQRATQYAHYTPEPVIRALWRAAQRLGFQGGRVLEPGMGTGLFFALLPPALRGACRLTGIEYDPVTARIARLVHPKARVRCEDYTRSPLGGGFDLVIGNPPFADRAVRADPRTAKLGLRLHDYFIARSVERLRPGGIALFVSSTGTLDKSNTTAREHIASLADLVGAVRLPEASMRAAAGTDVVVDLLAFQRRAAGQPAAGPGWIGLTDVAAAARPSGGDPQEQIKHSGALEADDRQDGPDDHEDAAPRRTVVPVNAYFAAHPEMVLGDHAQRRGIYGPGLSYTCRARAGAGPLEASLDAALARLPAAIVTASPPSIEDDEPDAPAGRAAAAGGGAAVREGCYLVGTAGRLMQVIGGEPAPVAIRDGKGGEGLPARSAKIIRALLPIRDAVREVLRAQAADQPWTQAQVQLRVAYSAFIRSFGPINHTVVSVAVDAETGEERESHRRPNLSPFADDPDCWLVASIERYDLETGLARKGPIFSERVIAPPAAPLIVSAADALAVTLADTGRVDLDHLAGLLERDPDSVPALLGATVFRSPGGGHWETADAYLSGAVRGKLAAAEAAAARDPHYQRNVDALRAVQPADLRPSDITARLGAPWIPADVVEAFAAEAMGTETRVRHVVELASWSVDGDRFAGTAAGTSEWGTARRHAGLLLHDALNSATPQIHDLVVEAGVERRVLNAEATEAAKEKLTRIKDAFAAWVWTDPGRTDRLARIYNDTFNNLAPRHFDGSHLTLPGASGIIQLYGHQKRVIWRVIASGSSYMAHAVGSGKTFSIAAAVMEQKRLGLISKALLTVPGHCLAQASREFLQLYPAARILVADESNFTKDKRARFLARAATACWDAVILTHSAFRFIAVPAEFERGMIQRQLGLYEAVALTLAREDRATRKRVEAMKEKLAAKLEAIKGRRDDMLTIEELGVDQVIVDEAQEFRKLSFATNRGALKGVDPDGSQRAWDLFLKARFIERKNPGRALIQASGTPITNTLGEMYTILRFQADAALRQRGVHAFDAWASTFGDTRTELELQPSGAYKPVERFSSFINVPELIDMFRSVADVALKEDLRGDLALPSIRGGERKLVTAPASAAFRDYQGVLAERIEAIRQRTGKVRKGDDILLAVITDGRHAAIDMRLVWPGHADEPDNKLNALIAAVHRIWSETAGQRYRRPDGAPDPHPGAGQMIFSDLGTLGVEAARGFSAYRWIKQELVRLGVPASEIAFMQDYKTSADKRRMLDAFNAGRVRVLVGSSETMGTGVNAQARLKALHHLDVPWLPSHIEQREGRIERQGNQNGEIEIYAYATLGSMDATMWQNNERKARFIAAALSGDRSVRRVEDLASQANQFAMAKAIASGDSRLMRKAGLETEIARLQRQQAAHVDDQHDIRRRIHAAQSDQRLAEARIEAIRHDLARRTATRGDRFAMTVEGRAFTDRAAAGALLLSTVRLAAADTTERDWTVARIGGFDLGCNVSRDRPEDGFKTTLTLERNNVADEVALGPELKPLGLIARLEHMLGRFDAELEENQAKAADAARRRAGYAARADEAFPLQGELDDKLARMAELEADLARTKGINDDAQAGPAVRAA